jgi:NACalpha-BTF3-like transcription factor
MGIACLTVVDAGRVASSAPGNFANAERINMKKAKFYTVASAIAATGIALAFAGPACADTLSRDSKHATKTDYKLTVEQAEAEYKTAKADCAARKGNDKDVCLREAKSAYESAKAEAKAAQKAGNAYAEADEDKREANYKVAKERCDVMTGDAKDACIERAKAAFGQ